MDYKKTLLAVGLSSAMIFSYGKDFSAIIGIEGSVAEKVGTIYKNITPWVDEGSQYDCTIWTPDTLTIDYGLTFEQTQECKQNQTRNKDLYTVYDSGAEVFEKTEKEDRTVDETNKQNNVGTKNIIIGTTNGSWEAWNDSSSHYDCGSYSPSTSTINYGQVFTQTRTCKQDQTRNRTIYDDWADGSQSVNRTESDYQTINENETRSATGTKNYVASTSTSTGSWSNSGGVYSCSSWSPSTSTVNSGTRFTQTRTCKQNQTQPVTTYNHWADGSTTVKSTSSNSRAVNVNQSQTATGTKPITGTWVRINSSGTKYGCSSGSGLSGPCSPLGATEKRWVPNGQSSGVPVCTEATYRCQ